ncbi:MAG: hypothetical protein ACXVH3_33920 [Solirubrobacteraceae bacterium]
MIASIALALGLPGIANGASLAQTRADLGAWNLQPAPLFPSQPPPSLDGANVNLYRWTGMDYDLEFGKPDNGCQRVDSTDVCVSLRRADAATLDQILQDPQNQSAPQEMQVGSRTVWFVEEGRDAGGWEMAWHEQGKTYIAWEWTSDASTALATLSPLVESLQPVSPPACPINSRVRRFLLSW